MPKPLARIIRETFTVKTQTPEEFAARESHKLINLGFRFEDHEDPELETWLYQLRSILDDEEKLWETRRKYLTPEELEQIRREMTDEFY